MCVFLFALLSSPSPERAVVAEDVEEDEQHAEALDDDEDTAHRADDNNFGAVGRVKGVQGGGSFLNFCLLRTSTRRS